MNGWIITNKDDTKTLKILPKNTSIHKPANRINQTKFKGICSLWKNRARIPSLYPIKMSRNVNRTLMGNVHLSKIHKILAHSGFQLKFMTDGLCCPITNLIIKKTSFMPSENFPFPMTQLLFEGYQSKEYFEILEIFRRLYGTILSP